VAAIAMKIKDTRYCRDCKEVFSKALACPACGSTRIVGIRGLLVQVIKLVDTARGEVSEAAKG